MADKERNALIPLPSGGLENIGSGPKSILSGMVSDALALARVRGKPADVTTKHTKLSKSQALAKLQQLPPKARLEVLTHLLRMKLQAEKEAQSLADRPQPLVKPE